MVSGESVVDLEVNSVSGDGVGDGSVEPLTANSEVLMLVVDSLLVLETVGSFAIGKQFKFAVVTYLQLFDAAFGVLADSQLYSASMFVADSVDVHRRQVLWYLKVFQGGDDLFRALHSGNYFVEKFGRSSLRLDEQVQYATLVDEVC